MSHSAHGSRPYLSTGAISGREIRHGAATEGPSAGRLVAMMVVGFLLASPVITLLLAAP